MLNGSAIFFKIKQKMLNRSGTILTTQMLNRSDTILTIQMLNRSVTILIKQKQKKIERYT